MAEQLFGSTAHAQAMEQRADKLAAQYLTDAPAEPPQAAPAEPPAVTQEPAPSEPQEAPEAEPEYANLEDYLAKANLDKESFYDLPARVKVDGKESDVPLKDILKSYQLEKHVQENSRAIAEQRKAWEAERTQAQGQLKQQLDDAQALGNLAHQQLLQEFQGVDWNSLRVNNPSEWAVRNTEFQQRANAIQNHLAQVRQKQDQLAAEKAKEHEGVLAKERDRMYEARPEWRDTKVFQSARDEMSTYARALGFTDAELGSIFDHRYMQVLHDAARFAALQAKAPEVAKRVRTAPKSAAPGARITRDPSQVAAQQARERFMKNPRDLEAQVAYAETLAR